MPRYIVPQLKHESKIVGPLTFRQFLFIGGAGAVCFFLYFTIPFFIFLLASALIMLLGAGLAFGQVRERPLTDILKNFFSFQLEPKLYLWKKKAGPPPRLVQEKKPGKKPTEEETVPAITGKSRLQSLSTKVETKK